MTPSAFKAMGTTLLNAVADPAGTLDTFGFASTGDGRWGRFDNIYAGGVRSGLNIGRPSDAVCFFEGTPTTRASAYTQTYSTATKTHSAFTATSIAAAIPAAAPAGGTGATEGAYDTAANRNLMITTVNDLRTWAIEMDADYEALLVDVANLKQVVNSLIDDLQAYNLVA